jgi:hypothetical protein
MTAGEGMERLQAYLGALGRFGSTAFIVGMYGAGEVGQAFCRLAAVNGAIYMLRTWPRQWLLGAEAAAAAHDAEAAAAAAAAAEAGGVGAPADGAAALPDRCAGIVDNTGRMLRARAVLAAPQYLPHGWLSDPSEAVDSERPLVTAYAVCITDAPLPVGADAQLGPLQPSGEGAAASGPAAMPAQPAPTVPSGTDAGAAAESAAAFQAASAAAAADAAAPPAAAARSQPDGPTLVHYVIPPGTPPLDAHRSAVYVLQQGAANGMTPSTALHQVYLSTAVRAEDGSAAGAEAARQRGAAALRAAVHFLFDAPAEVAHQPGAAAAAVAAHRPMCLWSTIYTVADERAARLAAAAALPHDGDAAAAEGAATRRPHNVHVSPSPFAPLVRGPAPVRLPSVHNEWEAVAAEVTFAAVFPGAPYFPPKQAEGEEAGAEGQGASAGSGVGEAATPAAAAAASAGGAQNAGDFGGVEAAAAGSGFGDAAPAAGGEGEGAAGASPRASHGGDAAGEARAGPSEMELAAALALLRDETLDL